MKTPTLAHFERHKTQFTIPQDFSQGQADAIGRALTTRRRLVELSQEASRILLEIENARQNLGQLALEYDLNFNALKEDAPPRKKQT